MEWKFGILFLWVGLSLTVGLFAKRRGRDGINWFMFAILISPPVAALLVYLLPEEERFHGEIKFDWPSGVRQNNLAPQFFVPDGFYAGVPYKVTQFNEIDAVTLDGVVRFATLELFLAFATRRNVARSTKAQIQPVFP